MLNKHFFTHSREYRSKYLENFGLSDSNHARLIGALTHNPSPSHSKTPTTCSPLCPWVILRPVWEPLPHSPKKSHYENNKHFIFFISTNCTKGFHGDIYIHAYNVLWSSSPHLSHSFLNHCPLPPLLNHLVGFIMNIFLLYWCLCVCVCVCVCARTCEQALEIQMRSWVGNPSSFSEWLQLWVWLKWANQKKKNAIIISQFTWRRSKIIIRICNGNKIFKLLFFPNEVEL
jgi:hypothetical protein